MFKRFPPTAAHVIPVVKTVALHAAVATIVIVIDRKLTAAKN